MFAVQYHNAHAASEDTLYGPFETLDAAKAKLAALVAAENDPQFRDRTTELNEEHGCLATLGFAGFDPSELAGAGRDEELASEVWAEVHPLVG